MNKLTLLLPLLAALHGAGAGAENLYNEKTYRPLASDKRAHLPGDVLTVLIYESSSAITSADAQLKRSTQAGLAVKADRHAHSASVGTSNDFDGGGTVQRAGKMLAQMSVTITGLAPNGDLLVMGEQLLEINSDKQLIKVEGRVRALDISDTNTVMSYRLADARISYIGDGDLANRQRPGIWSRLFTWMGL